MGAAQVATIASTVLFLNGLLLQVASYLVQIPYSASIDEPPSAIPIGGFRFFLCEGAIWIYNGDSPYQGSIICLEGSWGGKAVQRHSDWEWEAGEYGICQDSFIQADGKSAGCARYGDLPGVYYRHFEMWNCKEPWTTLALTMWYPIALAAILPGFTILRGAWKRGRYSLRSLFAAITVVAVLCAMWVLLS